ncbi:MAG: EI24 domain-containing protein [Sphingomonadales bacterium]|nr:EI24 domain-containing protein [Sphingomonadales bacterium]
MIFTAIGRGLSDLFRPGAMKVLLKGIGLALALLIALWLGLLWLIGLFVPETVTLPWVGEIGWIGSAVGFASFGVMLIASVFLMAPVTSIFTGFFLEEVAEMVEGVHYPQLPAVRSLSLAESLGDTLRFFGVILGANLLALVIYPFVIPLAPLLFLGLNGYLLGREYFQMAAQRRMHRPEARALYDANRGTVWLTGALLALPLSIPIVNLAVPVVGAAVFTHLFHALRGR